MTLIIVEYCTRLMAEKDKQKSAKTQPERGGRDKAAAALGDVRKQAGEARKALTDGGAPDAQKAETLLKQGQALSKQMQENGGKLLSPEALKQVAGEHADPKMLAMLQQAQTMSENGGADIGAMAGLAAQLGEQVGLSGQQGEWLKTFGGELGKELDTKEAGKVPGLVVDRESGKISVLGLINLDAKDPTSRLIAQGFIAANTLLLMPLNEKLFESSYKGASWLGSQVDLNQASKHRIGYAAALGATAFTSFWPDISGYIRLEKQGRKDIMNLASRFAPLLDDYDKSGSRVAQLYQIRPEDNEIIYNERRRAGMEHNAERFRHAVDALGRVPLYAISVLRGRGKLPGLKQEAAAEAVADKLDTGLDAEGQYWKDLGDKAKFIEEQSGGRISGDKALEMAKERVEQATRGLKPGEQVAGELAQKAEGAIGQIGRDAVNGAVLLAAPIMGMVAQNLHGQRLKDLDIQPKTAADMIFHLRSQLDDDPKAEWFSLPEGMSVQGAKNGSNQLKLEDYVEQTFQQHEKDSRGSNASIPARHSERLESAAKKIADALREGRLDGLALIRLVGERQIVRERGKSVATEEIVEHEIARLEAQMRHIEYVDDRRYFEESSFTREQLKESWDGMQPDEREVFAQFVPPQVLESAGVEPKTLREMRHKRQEQFYEDLAQVTKKLLELGDDTLKKMGMTRAESALLHRVEDVASQKGCEAIGKELARDINTATHAIVNTLVSSRIYQGHVEAAVMLQK